MTARMRVAALTLSAAGIVGIGLHEGYRDRAYAATEAERSQGVWTIGFGETNGVRQGDSTSVEKSLVRLLATTSEFQGKLKSCMNPEAEMTQAQFDILVSWAYNIGPGAACKSTLIKRLNQGQEWCSELLRWDRQGGVQLPGLTKRRKEEYHRCVAS